MNTIVYKNYCIQQCPSCAAPLGETIKKMKGVGYLLVKCRGHLRPLPSKQGFQKVQRTLGKTLHSSLPPKKQQGNSSNPIR